MPPEVAALKVPRFLFCHGGLQHTVGTFQRHSCRSVSESRCDLFGNGAVQRTENHPEVFEYCAGAHHGWNTPAAVFDRSADGLNLDSQPLEVAREPRLR